MYVHPSELKLVQWEPTSLCNANCIGCPRTDHDTMLTHPFIVKTQRHTTNDEIQSFIDSIADPRLEKLETVMFNGEIGDAMMHPDIDKIIIGILKARPNINVEIHTNGGGAWGRKFKKICEYASNSNSKVYIVFSVDGLEDTNHLYRRNVIWKNIVKNAGVVSQYNVNKIWRWCTFDHNKHQVQEAKQLAEDWNFDFVLNNGVWGQEMVTKYKGKKSNSKLYKEKLNQYPTRTFIEDIPDSQYTVTSVVDLLNNKKDIKSDVCVWQYKKEVQIVSDMTVWPCCWTAHYQYYYKQNDERIWDSKWKYYKSPELRGDNVLTDLREWEELFNANSNESYYEKKDIRISKNFLLYDVLISNTFVSIGNTLKTDNTFNLNICKTQCRKSPNAQLSKEN